MEKEQFPKTMIAKHNFKSQNEGELSFNKGDM